ncbi:MAG: hypothetical protein JO159_16210 [Acidobacteria bacterium]|nr:hypothetical protein [Acidobacteriota bacterium]
MPRGPRGRITEYRHYGPRPQRIPKISGHINTISNLELLQRDFLELVFEVTPATRGAIVLTSEIDEFGTVTSFYPCSKAPEEVNRRLVNRVLSEHAPIVSEPESTGVGDGPLVLCAPISGLRKTLARFICKCTESLIEENHAIS